ncbi:hypothetical protein E2P81_ATG12008 [Venturia nashicola]|nr:hypothetical protein E2P81_ATG12008 [Venturia nashicola]
MSVRSEMTAHDSSSSSIIDVNKFPEFLSSQLTIQVQYGHYLRTGITALGFTSAPLMAGEFTDYKARLGFAARISIMIMPCPAIKSEVEG